MGEVVWGINCSLDGRCGHEDGLPDADTHRYATKSFEGVDVLLLGRVTYELMFPYWATVAAEQSGEPFENEFAVKMTEIPKVLFSSTLDTSEWNTRSVSTSAVDEVRRLRDEGGRLHLGASVALAASLRAAGLIDRFAFFVQPIVVGRGPTLFRDGEQIAMTLNSAVPWDAGSVALDYSVDR